MAPEEKRERQRRYERAYRAAHPEKVREKNRKAYLADPKKNQEKVRRWYAAHPGKESDRNRNWRVANPDRKRETRRKYRAANPDKLREAIRKWRAMNAHKVREDGRLKARNRRALLAGAPGKHSAKDERSLYERQGGKCAACGIAVPRGGPGKHVDHVDPITPRDGGPPGSNGPENLQILCRRCNDAKGNMAPTEWAQRLGRLFV